VRRRPPSGRLLDGNAGRILIRRDILDRVWAAATPTPTRPSTSTSVGSPKIEPAPRSPIRIRTVRGIGYIFDPTD
jgi:DNA-binding response OmpR family regulator